MKKFLLKWKIKRLYRRGNKLLEQLDYITAEHAKHRQIADEIDEADSVLSAWEHTLKADLYSINARLCKVEHKSGFKCNLFDFECCDYSGVLA